MTWILTDFTDYLGHSVSQCGCTSCIKHRHTDDTDFNGFHGLFRSQCITVWMHFVHQDVGTPMTRILTDFTDYLGHNLSQCGCTLCIKHRHADDTDFNGFHGLFRSLCITVWMHFVHQNIGTRMTRILTDFTDYLGHSVSQWKTVYHSVDALCASNIGTRMTQILTDFTD